MRRNQWPVSCVVYRCTATFRLQLASGLFTSCVLYRCIRAGFPVEARFSIVRTGDTGIASSSADRLHYTLVVNRYIHEILPTPYAVPPCPMMCYAVSVHWRGSKPFDRGVFACELFVWATFSCLLPKTPTSDGALFGVSLKLRQRLRHYHGVLVHIGFDFVFHFAIPSENRSRSKYREREREKERGRGKEGQSEGRRERQREKKREGETEREKERERERENERERGRERDSRAREASMCAPDQ